MATGFLNRDGLPYIEIELYGNTVPAVIDTGFEGALQLPSSWFDTLNPSQNTHALFQLPTGEVRNEPTYLVPISVAGEAIDADTIFLDSNEVLLGIEILIRFRLTIDFPAGTVLLERVAPSS